MQIAGRPIGTDHPPYIVAEMSGNHGGSLRSALAIVDAVAEAGADAIKLQTYTADTMTLNVGGPGFVIDDPGSLWYGRQLHELYEEAHTPLDWHRPIFERARQQGLTAFSAPFDPSAVDLLEQLDAPAHKIASFECVDLPLIRHAAATGKPLIISTGLATAAEIDAAAKAARDAGCEDLMLLVCTSSYPAPPQDSNLATIPHLRSWAGVEVGLSDHTLGIGAALASVALGATLVEKHVTLSRANDTVDAEFSLEPHELAALVEDARRAWQAVGRVHYGPTPGDVHSLSLRRSLYVTADLRTGDVLSPDNVRAIRPGHGLPPGELNKVLGLRVARNTPRGTPLSWELLKDSPSR